jgi:prolyl oligopeptidase
VVAVSVQQPAQARWREIIPERQDAMIQNIAHGLGTIAVTYLKDASHVVEVFDLAGRSLGILKQPGIGSATLTAAEDRTEAYLTFTSFNHPPAVFRVDLASPDAAPVYWSRPDLPLDSATAEVRRVSYRSKDGTPISMFVVHRKGMAPSGAAPALLTGYGAFGVSMLPMFSGPFAQWVEAGGVLAVPHLRGGGEYGSAWHRAGVLGRKQNTIDDFIAAAEWLVANKHTNPQKLAVYGVASGALVGAAAITQRPELFRAAVLARPLADMLRYHRFVREPYWTAEYGSAENADQFRWLAAYSPYQRVAAGRNYPAILITAVEGDAESPALHARKIAAALQAATASDRISQPVVLRVDRPPQDPAALFTHEFRDLVDQRAFLNWQLGVVR